MTSDAPIVLPYARLRPRGRVLSDVARVGFVLVCGLIAATIFHLRQPKVYRATGSFILPSSSLIAPAQPPPPIPTIVPALTSTLNFQGIELTSAEIQSQLTVRPKPSSPELLISFDDPDPFNAAVVVNTVMNTYASTYGGTISSMAYIPVTPTRDPSFAFQGLFYGCLIGAGIAFLHWRSPRRAQILT